MSNARTKGLQEMQPLGASFQDAYESASIGQCVLLQSVLGAMGVNFDAEPSARTGLQVLPIGRTAFEVRSAPLAAFG